MKKLINLSFIYAIAAMVGGVFYREFTKFNGFEGRTTLGFVHTHLFLLGMIFLLLAALFAGRLPLTATKPFGTFMVFYNIGVPIAAIMLVVRGIPQVLGITLSKGASAAISGIAGIGHILIGVGLIFFFLALRKAVVTAGQAQAIQ